jgi:F420-dependent methylenetetrahydromethanopterin dehydrogenase
VTRWHSRPELTFLLEALSEDIIAATDEEVRQVHGRSVAAGAREVLRLIQAAREDKNEDLREDLGPDVCPSGAGPGPARAARRLTDQRH